jgi:hydrogenase nickel incorporation protein HypA/HybF
MHEMSIALSLIDLACEEGEQHAGRVTAVHVKLGRLSGVVREALESCYEMAAADTAIVGSRLVIEEVPVIVFCARCDRQHELAFGEWLMCPGCGDPTPDVRQGKELQLVALEIEE